MKPQRFSPALFLAGLLVFALACSLSLPAGLLPEPTPTPLPQPPALVETEPVAGSLVGVQPTISLFFNQPMQRETVQAALVSANGNAVITWLDDSSLAFTPAAAFQPSQAVRLTLPQGLTASNGLTSTAAQEISFQVAGPLRVEQILPADQTADVSPSAPVVVTFNQPVVPLGADPQSLPAAFSLEPAASGRGEWLNTSTYTFTPEPALPGGQSFTVNLNPGLTSTLGMALENPRSWQFVTSPPRVLEILPNADAKQPPQPTLTLRFNQPMDKPSVENGVSLACGAQAQPLLAWEWNERQTQVTFTPAQKLPRGSSCQVRVSAAARSHSGLPLAEEAVSAFDIYPLLGIDQVPASPKPFYQPFQLQLSAPLAEDADLAALASVSPPVSGFSVVNYFDRVDFYGDFAAGQEYVFTLQPGLRDAFGETLQETLNFSGATAPREPTLELPYTGFLFVRPAEPVASARVSTLNRLELNRSASLDLSGFFALSASYDAQKAYTFPGGQSWQAQVPYAEQMLPYDLSLTADGGPLAPGVYLMGVFAPEGVNPYSADRRMFVVASNINLTFKISARNALVWAVDVRTGQPVSGALVNLYDQAGQRLGGGSTSPQGLWSGPVADFDLSQGAWAVLNAPGDDAFGLAGSSFNPGLSPWELGLSVNYGGQRPFVYLYSDRPVYRPGDTVYIHGMALDGFYGRYAPLSGGPSGWEIALQYAYQDAQNPQALSLSPYGAFDTSFDLPLTAAPGYWNVEVRAPQPGSETPLTFSLPLQVADYRKPELDPQVTFTPAEIASGQSVSAQVQVNYFFGSPAPDVPVSWTLYRQPQRFDLPGYETGPYLIPWRRSFGTFGETVKSGSGLTDAQGRLNLNFDNLQADSFSLYRLEVTVTETGGFPVSASGELKAHPGPLYAGIAPRSFTAAAGQEMTFDLLAADWNQTPQPGQNLSLTWEKVTWKNSPTPYGGYTYQLQAETLENKTVTTDAQGGAAAAFTPATAGTYRLRAAAGNNFSETLVWVGGSGFSGWPALPFDQINLTAGQKTYEPGQTASVFIPNPFEQPALSLITLERGDILDSRLLTVAPGGEAVSLPLTDDNAPNTFVSALLLGPGTQFRLGYLNLNVTPRAFTLTTSLQANPQTAHPGDTVTIDLSVTDSQGSPAQGEFSLAVVDLAALALADPNAPDILPAFYDSQPLGVRTGLTDAMDSRRLLPNPGGMGGGGGADVLPLRENFPDTALWTTFVTDSAGKASVQLTLPDSLTTWQVDARGLDAQMRVGQAQMQIVTRKELLLRPITPRFLLVGDHLRLGTSVNNTTDQEFSAQVSLKAEGVTLDPGQAAEQKVTLPAGGRAQVWWWVTVNDAASARLAFRAQGGGWSDATLPADGELPILRYSAPQTFSTGGVLSEAGTRSEILSLPRRFTPLGGQLRLEIAPSLGAYVLKAAESLAPPDEFASNEELASYLLSTLALAQSGSGYSLPPQATLAAQRLLSHQNSDGGWNWYWANFGANESTLEWTAYAVLALTEARQQNALPAGDWSYTFQNAADYLTARLQNSPAPQSMSADMLESGALTAWALTQAGVNSPLLTDTLAGLTDRAEALSPAAQAFTLLASRQAGLDTSRLTNLLEQGAQRSATGAFWQNSALKSALPRSTVFQTAAVMNALPENTPLMTEALRFLVFSRQPGGQWAFGMENALAYRALSAWMRLSGDSGSAYTFSAAVNNRTLLNTQGNTPIALDLPISALYAQAPNALTIQRGPGAGSLFYRADLQVMRPAQSAAPLNAGMALSREYFDCSAAPCQPISSWNMTDTPGRISVRLTLTVPAETRYLALEDFSPAGAEIANPALKTTQQGEPAAQADLYDPESPFETGWGWWYFQPAQIYRDHIRWNAQNLPAGTYVLTYTLVPSLAGEFQVPPARAWQIFFPEVQGTSAGAVFQIKP